MSHTDTERLFANVRLHVPGALDDVLRLEYFNVLSEFFTASNCWHECIPFKTRPNQRKYDIAPTSIGQIERLVGVADENEIAFAALYAGEGSLVLRWPPDTVKRMSAEVMLNVADPVDREDMPGIPGWVLPRYHIELADGLIGRLLGQPVKPYSNERLSIYHLRRFRNGCARARVEANTMNLYGGQRWRFPRAGMPSRRYR